MTGTIRLCIVAIVAGTIASPARADVPLVWTIDSTHSYAQLAIPQQAATILGVSYTVRMVNQSGGSTWTTGNKASLGGTLSTQVDAPAQMSEIEFDHQTNLNGINSGNYIPDPSTWNGTKFTSDTATAPAEFGGMVQASLGFNIWNSGIQSSISNVMSEMTTSGAFVPVSGGIFPTFSTTFGVSSATFAGHGIGTLEGIAQSAGQTLDYYNTTGSGSTAFNTITTGAISYNGPHTTATLTESINIPVTFNLGSSKLSGTVTGLVEATAQTAVPGDVNLDGIVNGQDIAVVASHWLHTQAGGSGPGDANGDGIVNGQDIALIASNWLHTFGGGGAGGGGAAVPEPSSVILLLLGAAVALVRVAPRRARPS